MEEEGELVEWKTRRTKTFIGFLFEAVALGMEYSLTFITLWLYLEQTIKTQHLKFYYSLISAAYLSSQVLSSIVFGRLADKFRNIRELFLAGNLLIIIGNILYTVPLSPWFLFVGRLISGGGGCLRCIMTGELARSFPDAELSSKFSLMGMAFGLGFIVGPGINFVFLHADFWIGNIHIVYANAPGFYLAIIFILLQLVCTTMISNLSQEFDLKDSIELQSLPTDDEYPSEVPPISNEKSSLIDKKGDDISVLSILHKMFMNIDTFLILVFSFFFMYCMVSFDLWQPLAVLKLNQWGVLQINIIIFSYGVISVFVLLLMSYFPLNDKVIVYFSMICTFCISAINIIFVVFVQVRGHTIVNIILWFFYALFFALVVVMEEVFLIGVMAKMTSSAQQSFTESIRLGFSRAGALVALLSAAASFSHLTLICSVLATLGFIGISLISVRKQSLQCPKVLIK